MKRRATTSVLAADLNGLENHPGRQEKKDRAVRKNMSVASTLVAVCAIATMLSYQGQKTMAEEGPADTAHAGPELVIGQTGKAPQIDGVLDDRAWEDAARVEYRDSNSAKAPREKTQAWVACDKEHLYFAFKCHESQMDKLAVKQTEINELLISLDDCIEIFLTPPIDPPPPAGSYYQLMINANGIFYAASPYNGTRWKPDIKVGAKRLPDSWILEVSITFQSLNRGSPSAGEVWSVNIGREQKTHGVNLLSAFSPVGSNFHTPELFGTFRFEKKTPQRVGNYSFGGRVITENGPLEGARVVIGQQIAFTDSSGDFTIDHLPTGAQTLSVTKSGFRPVYKPVVRQIELDTNQVAKEPFFVETVMVTAYGFNWSLGAVAAEKNYQIYFNHVNTPVAPGTRLSEDQTAEQHDMTLKTVATLDSYEPVTFTVFSNEELGECTVSVGDMVCAEDPSQRIKAATADVRVVQVWIPPVELGGSGAYRPEILKPLTAVDIGPKTFRQFWITYHIPPDTRGGSYQGDITFRPANKAKTVLRSEMTVFPFRLQKSKDKRFGVFYLGGGGKSGVFNMDKKKSDYRGDFIDMHQHGVDGLVFPGEPAFKRAADGTIAIDFELVDHALDVLKEIGWKDVSLVMNFSPMNRNLSYVTGITGDDINAGNLTEEHITALKEVIAGINKRVRERGFETPYYMWYDEITALGHVEFWVNLAKVFKPISDGGKSFITLLHTASKKHLDMIAPYLDAAVSGDMPAIDSISEVKAAYPAISEWHVYGGIGGSFRENRRNNGCTFYRAPVSYTWGWAYQAIVKDQKEGAGRLYPWLTATVPAEDGSPMPTLQWEGYREGCKDLGYMVALERAIARSESLPARSDAVKEGKKLLDAVRVGARPEDNKDFDVLRREMGEAITQLFSQ